MFRSPRWHRSHSPQDRIGVDHDGLTVGARSRELVSHDQRRFTESGVPDAVQFAPAYPGRPNLDEDFAVGYLGLADVEQFERARPGEDERLHRAGAVPEAGAPGSGVAGAMTAGTVPPSGCVSRGRDSLAGPPLLPGRRKARRRTGRGPPW